MFSALRYKIIDLARGTDSISLLNALRQWQYESHEQLQAREKTQLATYFDAMRSPALFRDVEQFSDLPVLDKRFINTHSEQLRNPHYKGKVIRKKTGGSTGEPLVYYSSTESQSYLWAGIFLAWEAAGFQLGDKVAFLAGSSLFGNGYRNAYLLSLAQCQRPVGL
jgi:phenylacetate-CoA ligase